jgi:hypothetical protein
MLLYCSMSVNNAGFARGRFDFALPHAVNLAEIGQSAHDKRIGTPPPIISTTAVAVTSPQDTYSAPS